MAKARKTDDEQKINKIFLGVQGWFGDNRQGVYVSLLPADCMRYCPVGEVVTLLCLQVLPGRKKVFERPAMGADPDTDYDR